MSEITFTFQPREETRTGNAGWGSVKLENRRLPAPKPGQWLPWEEQETGRAGGGDRGWGMRAADGGPARGRGMGDRVRGQGWWTGLARSCFRTCCPRGALTVKPTDIPFPTRDFAHLSAEEQMERELSVPTPCNTDTSRGWDRKGPRARAIRVTARVAACPARGVSSPRKPLSLADPSFLTVLAGHSQDPSPPAQEALMWALGRKHSTPGLPPSHRVPRPGPHATTLRTQASSPAQRARTTLRGTGDVLP